MFEHPFLWLVLQLIIYRVFIYTNKKTKKKIEKFKSTLTKKERIIGKVFTYSYIFCIAACFFISVERPYQGTSTNLALFVKFLSYNCIKCTIIIELILCALVLFKQTSFEKNLYAAAIELKANPRGVYSLRLFGLILYLMYIFISLFFNPD